MPTLFLALILLVTTLEMIFFVSPERRDDKYLVMLQPALLLLAADGLARLGSRISDHISANRKIGSSAIRLSAVLALVACLALIAYNWSATESLLARSGPDYDTAFSYVRDQWQAGDAVLTGTPAAAALYLGRNDYYAVRGTGGYAYRILERDAQKVERWMGSTWLETDEDIQAALSGSPRVWLILERWGLIEEYYAPVTMQRILAMTDFVREDNGIIVLRSIPAAQLIPESPPVGASVNFGHLLRLEGYHLTRQPGESSDEEKDSLSLVLYWQALRPLPYDYTVFVHLRDADGQAVVQADHQPLVPIYPPTLWPVGQTIRERSTLDISGQVPPGTYMLWVGVYRLDTLERLPIIGDRSGENAYLLAEEVVD